MKKYNSYRESGIKWLGEIPEHWKSKKLKFIFNNKNSIRIPLSSEERGQMAHRIYDYYGASGVIDKVEDYLFDEELILIGEDGANLITRTKRLAFIASGKYWVNNHAHILKPINGDIYYLCELLEMIDYSIWISGSAQPKLTQEALFSINMFEPPIEEQTQIANYLDQKTTQIDELIAKKERLIQLLDEERTAIINQAVTKGLNPDALMKDSGIEWLGEIPEHWENKRLRYVAKCQNGISEGAEFFGEGNPFVSYSDVYNNRVLPKQVQGLAKSEEKHWSNYSVQQGDIFLTRTSETIEEIGISSVCEHSIEKAIFAGFLIRVRPFEGLMFQGFSKYYFNCFIPRIFFVKEMNLVTRASLSQELLKRLPVLLPPIDEQKQIAQSLDEKCKKIERTIKASKKEIDYLKEYKTTLISEVVTGKIDVREEVLDEII